MHVYLCRFVVHYTLSKSLEGYFQEAGRAGRDGLKSECVIFFAIRDTSRIVNMIRHGGGGRVCVWGGGAWRRGAGGGKHGGRGTGKGALWGEHK